MRQHTEYVKTEIQDLNCAVDLKIGSCAAAGLAAACGCEVNKHKADAVACLILSGSQLELASYWYSKLGKNKLIK